MRRFLARRLLAAVPVLWGVSTLVFALVHFIPGDPVTLMLGESAAPADADALRRQLGLDRPLAEQYLGFLGGLARGDLGQSIASRRPVADRIAERYPATLGLTLASLLVACLIAFPLGVLAAVRRGSWIDRGGLAFALLGVSVPTFWLGPLLVLLFSIQLRWLPVSGRAGPLSYVLPALTLGTGLAAILTRLIRASLLETLRADHLRAARARGLSYRRAVLAHGLRNALLPVVTILGLQFGGLLAGSIITETIFAWPGIGRLAIEAIQSRDFPLVQGCVLAIAASYVAINLATDLGYAFLDPRIRLGEKR